MPVREKMEDVHRLRGLEVVSFNKMKDWANFTQRTGAVIAVFKCLKQAFVTHGP